MTELEEVIAGKRSWWIEQGDVLVKLKDIPSGAIHACVTSPPYWG